MDYKNLIIRTISGLILASIFLIGIFYYRFIFYLAIYLISIFMLYEWYYILKKQINYQLIGVSFTLSFLIAMLFITGLDEDGYLLLTMFCSIATVDIMAMIGGKILRGPKLAQKISPNKTISGLICGSSFAIFIANLLRFLPNYHLPNQLHEYSLLFSFYILIIAFTAQASDLLVSIFKRRANIKDTGNIIPGHGGVLDRFDSFILTSIVIAAYLFFTN